MNYVHKTNFEVFEGFLLNRSNVFTVLRKVTTKKSVKITAKNVIWTSKSIIPFTTHTHTHTETLQ